MAAGGLFSCLSSLFRIVNIYTAVCILQFSASTTDTFNAKLLLALTIVLDVLQVNDIDFSGTHVVVYALSGWILDRIHFTTANHQAIRNMLQDCFQVVVILINLVVLITKRTAIHLIGHYQQCHQSWFQSQQRASRYEEVSRDNEQAPAECPVLPAQSSYRFVSSDLNQCTQLLAGRKLTLNNGDIVNNDLNPYTSRAITNERLITAFGIGNCFVVDQKKICEEFRKKANEAVKKTDIEWAALGETLKSSLAGFIQADRIEVGEKYGSFQVAVVPKVQALCLKIVLVAFQDAMGLALVDMDDDFFYNLADEINQQWIASKDNTNVDEWSYQANDRLRNLVARLLPTSDTEPTIPQNTPLNFILPGYETLWRVVLRCYLEVSFRPNRDDRHAICQAAWRKSVVAFAEDPTPANLERIQLGVSAAMVAKEALRIYPPTRRIYRHFRNNDQDIVAAADIEALHRQMKFDVDGQASSVWGLEPMAFNPCRWDEITAEIENENFLAFGAKPFVCPAKKGSGGAMSFGVAMVALVVGTLVAGMSPDEWFLELSSDEEDAWYEGKPMRTGRSDYASAWLSEKCKEAVKDVLVVQSKVRFPRTSDRAIAEK
ncbi:hypothetical protein KVT40_007671 [Elsinoe batatas]|uniref:Uncharacterized protein n=1 Tax=Elsinoe batatas TaxID=2601811 RepID=A0A8K0KVC8_9PEZI|nr:hypothetical protein KVT40_007671 [Elsinoe batatas]